MTTHRTPAETQPSGIPELIVDLDEVKATGPGGLRYRPRILRHPTRYTARAAILTTAVAVFFAGYAAGDGALPIIRSETPTSPVQSGTAMLDQAVVVLRARLIVPETASPGERLTVLAYRNPKLCGPVELRFDGAAVPHRVARPAAGRDGHSFPMFFMSMEVPRFARPGIHQINLFGPVQSTGGEFCGDVLKHQARMATAAITIKPAPEG